MSNVSIAGYAGWPTYDTFLIVSLSGQSVYDPNPLRPNPNPKKPVLGLCRVRGLGRILTPLIPIFFVKKVVPLRSVPLALDSTLFHFRWKRIQISLSRLCSKYIKFIFILIKLFIFLFKKKKFISFWFSYMLIGRIKCIWHGGCLEWF